MATSNVERRGRSGSSSAGKWLGTLAATFLSTYALDAVATASGVLLAASQLLADVDRTSAVVFLATT